MRHSRRGSLNFPAPSSVLPVTWRTLEGSPRTPWSRLGVATPSKPAFSSFVPLQSTAVVPPVGVRSDLPLLGFVVPSPSTWSSASTPAQMLPSSLRDRRFLADHRVPTSWFLTTSPGFSAADSQVYCALLPILRFAAFLRRSTSPKTRSSAFPATLSPLEEALLVAAAPCRHGRSLRGVPCRIPPPISTEALLLRTFLTAFCVSVTFKVLLRSRALYRRTPYSGVRGLSFLGFGPLQGPSTRSRR